MVLLLIINAEVKPPDIIPKLNEAPNRKPIGSETVLVIRKSKLYRFDRFCEPRQRKKISNIAVKTFRVISCNLKNIFKVNFN